MKKIKILYVLTQLELGGAQKNVLALATGLGAEKYDIHLVTSHGALDDDAKKIKGLRLVFCPFLGRPVNPLADLAAFFFLVFYMLKNKIEVVHTHSSKAGIVGRWAAREAGVKVILHTIHGWGFQEDNRTLLNKIFIFCERQTARITSKLIAVSENDRRLGLKLGIGTPPQYALVRCCPENGFMDVAKERVDSSKAFLKIEPEDKTIGMVACLKPQKNPLDFVRAADVISKKIPNARFFLVGDGVLRSVVEEEIKKRRLEKVFFLLGWRRDLASLMSCFDVVVLTSLWEGLPVTCLEAMLLRKPIVAYDAGGIREVVHDQENGFLTPLGDFKTLASWAMRLLEEPVLRARMGEAGYRIASQDEFSEKTMSQKINFLVDDLRTGPRVNEGVQTI